MVMLVELLVYHHHNNNKGVLVAYGGIREVSAEESMHCLALNIMDLKGQRQPFFRDDACPSG